MPHFVLRRCPENFPKPPSEDGHFAYFLDYNTNKIVGKLGITQYSFDLATKPRIEDIKKLPILDDIAQSDENKRVFDEIVFIVNAVSNKFIFSYTSNQGWFITLDEGHKTYYGREGYLAPEYNSELESLVGFENYDLNELPILELVNSDSKTTRSIKLSDLFRLYYSSPLTDLKKKYLNACIVLTKAYQLRKIDISASYVFLVSAIESLIEIEYEKAKLEPCKCCGMTHYSVRQKFIKFLDKYGYKINKKTKDEFSIIRNGIVHKGQLLGMSYSSKRTIESQEELEAAYYKAIGIVNYESFHHLVLTCFRAFLLFNFEEKNTTVSTEPYK